MKRKIVIEKRKKRVFVPVPKFHAWMTARELKEGWIVVDLDQWGTCKNDHGGYIPQKEVIRGHFWPTRDRAIGAAAHVLKGHPSKRFGIMKLIDIVETAHPELNITKI